MVRRHGNLWESVVSMDNLRLAYRRASRGRKRKRPVERFARDLHANLEEIRRSLIERTFTTGHYTVKTVYEPKERLIYVLPFKPDRIVQHALMNVLAPIWSRSFIKDSFGNIPGRGLHAGSRRTMEFTRGGGWVLKCDISKFYPSIDHDILFGIISRKVKDRDVLWLVRDIIDSFPGGKNVPIGNYCSQWFGNVYLHGLDRFVKEGLKFRRYLRYCDDFCLFADGKAGLLSARSRIDEFLRERLGLRFSHADIFPVSRGLNFLGYCHFEDYITMRKSTLSRMRRILSGLPEMLARGEISEDSSRSSRDSIRGWLVWACTRNLRETLGLADFNACCRAELP